MHSNNVSHSNLAQALMREERRRREEERGRTKKWMSSVTFGLGGAGMNVIDGRKKRFWDWKEVGMKCVLPAAILYFVMTWGLLLRREWELAVGILRP